MDPRLKQFWPVSVTSGPNGSGSQKKQRPDLFKTVLKGPDKSVRRAGSGPRAFSWTNGLFEFYFENPG